MITSREWQTIDFNRPKATNPTARFFLPTSTNCPSSPEPIVVFVTDCQHHFVALIFPIIIMIIIIIGGRTYDADRSPAVSMNIAALVGRFPLRVPLWLEKVIEKKMYKFLPPHAAVARFREV
uniref:Uncharacterized protein n=1 Tax=Anopheles culicifacies TaxID=139723 RepID=A0A182MLT8_9DIPT